HVRHGRRTVGDDHVLVLDGGVAGRVGELPADGVRPRRVVAERVEGRAHDTGAGAVVGGRRRVARDGGRALAGEGRERRRVGRGRRGARVEAAGGFGHRHVEAATGAVARRVGRGADDLGRADGEARPRGRVAGDVGSAAVVGGRRRVVTDGRRVGR